MSQQAIVEHCVILTEMGSGLLARLYLVKNDILSASAKSQQNQSESSFGAEDPKYGFLDDLRLVKMLRKFEKTFPLLDPTILSEIREATNDATTDRVLIDCVYLNEILADITDFTRAAIDCLKGIFLSAEGAFPVEKSRCLSTAVFKLVACYVRVLYLLDSIEEKALLVCMYVAAMRRRGHDDATVAAYTTTASVCFDSCGANIHRHLTSSFSFLHTYMGAMLGRLHDALQVSAESRDIRAMGLLNPLADERTLGLPARNTLYLDLQYIEDYYDYVVFSLLVCPNLLLEEKAVEGRSALELFKIVTQHRLAVEIFRDYSLNIHIEFEKLSTLFPEKQRVPKGFKLNSALKHASRASISLSAGNQKQRRELLLFELSSWNNIITDQPGLLGPHFPQLLCVTGMARAEVLSYFRHAEGVAIRKDGREKAAYDVSHFQDPAVSALMSQLCRSQALVEKHCDIVLSYYVEYLVEVDHPDLSLLLTDHASDSESSVYLAAILKDLARISYTDTVTNKAAGESIRLNWLRATIAFTRQVHLDDKVIEELERKMVNICERLRYVGDLQGIQRDSINFFPATWYHRSYLAAFVSTYKDPFELAIHTSAFVRVLTNFSRDFHPDCPEESLVLMEKAQLMVHSLLADISSLVLTLLKFLWDFTVNLEGQCLPIEMANRLEKIQQVRKNLLNSAAVGQDDLPGYESEAWAKKSIEKLVLVRRHLCMIMTSCSRTFYPTATDDSEGGLALGNKIYHMDTFLQNQIATFFELHLSTLFNSSSNASHEKMSRPSIALQRLTACCRTIQYALSVLPGADLPYVVGQALFKESSDVKISAPGAPIHLNTEMMNKKSLVYKLSNWFVELVREITLPNSAIVWAPQQLCFLNVALSKQYVACGDVNYNNTTDASMASPVRMELFMDRDELKSLFYMVGVPAAKAINSQLLTFVANQVKVVLSFLKKFKMNLRDVESQPDLSPAYCATLRAVFLSSDGKVDENGQKDVTVDTLLEALVLIGVALVVRDSVMAGVRSSGEQVRMRNPVLRGLHSAVRTAVSAVSLLEAIVSPVSPDDGPKGASSVRSSVSAAACLAADLGINIENDLEENVDVALYCCLSQMALTPAELKLLDLFPAAAAVSLLSAKWERATYLPALDAFDGNEHCAQVAVSSLLAVFHIILSTAQSPSAGSKKQPSAGVKKGKAGISNTKKEKRRSASTDQPVGMESEESKGDFNHKYLKRFGVSAAAYPARYLLKAYIDRYLKISSFLLLKMRGYHQDNDKAMFDASDNANAAALRQFGQVPVRCMSALLEYFVGYCCPIQVRGQLQKYYPASLMQSDMLEISLGKRREGDSLNAFVHHSENVGLLPQDGGGRDDRDRGDESPQQE